MSLNLYIALNYKMVFCQILTWFEIGQIPTDIN